MSHVSLELKIKYHLSRISPTPDVCAFSRVTITPLASWIPVKCQPALVHPISPFAVIYLPERAQIEATNALHMCLACLLVKQLEVA